MCHSLGDPAAGLGCAGSLFVPLLAVLVHLIANGQELSGSWDRVIMLC
jgi:hypothetical protein